MWKFLNKGMSTPIGILIIILVAVIVGGGVLAWQYGWLGKILTPTPNSTSSETADWQTYRNEEYGFDIISPKGWDFSHIEKSLSEDNLPLVKFNLIPPEGLAPGWKFWGILYVGVHPYQPNINDWLDWFITKSYPNLKDELVATEIAPIGGKPTFTIDRTGEGLWKGLIITLGSEYSYSYTFSQDGAPDFVQRIMEEIFPYISIR